MFKESSETRKLRKERDNAKKDLDAVKKDLEESRLNFQQYLLDTLVRHEKAIRKLKKRIKNIEGERNGTNRNKS